jgi:excisionase family DNA binding protein
MTAAETLDRARAHFDAAFAELAEYMEALAEIDDLQMLTPAEACKLLRKSTSTIYEMCKDGRLMSVDGRIPRKVVRDYIDGKRHPTHTNLK